MRIFISYRRADSQTITDRIYERLAATFGKENVFQDVFDIEYGQDFRRVLKEQVGSCDILLVVIGKQWLTVKEIDPATGQETDQPRLFNPDDSVRIEVETGLSRENDTLVIPVLVNDAGMPLAARLPDSLKALSYLNAAPVRNNPYFDEDIARLIRRLQDYRKERDARKSTGTRSRLPIIAGVGGIAALVIIALVIFNQPPDIGGTDTPTFTHTATITEAAVTDTATPTLPPTNTPTQGSTVSATNTSTATGTATNSTPNPTNTPTYPYIIVNSEGFDPGETLNVRRGPGTVFAPRIGVLAQGASAEILGRNPEGTWIKIRFPAGEGGIGWVSADFVTINNGTLASFTVDAGPPTPTMTFTPTVTNTTQGTPTNTNTPDPTSGWVGTWENPSNISDGLVRVVITRQANGELSIEPTFVSSNVESTLSARNTAFTLPELTVFFPIGQELSLFGTTLRIRQSGSALRVQVDRNLLQLAGSTPIPSQVYFLERVLTRPDIGDILNPNLFTTPQILVPIATISGGG